MVMLLLGFGLGLGGNNAHLCLSDLGAPQSNAIHIYLFSAVRRPAHYDGIAGRNHGQNLS